WFASLGFCQTDTTDFRMAKSHIRNPQRIDRPIFLVRNFRYRDNALHPPDVRQLRRSEYDIANGVNAGFGSLHPFIGFHEAALGLNASFFETNAVGIRLTSNRDQNLFRLELLLFAVGSERHSNS